MKAFIAEEFSIPMETQQLFLGTKKMIDPMTLLDYPEIVPGGETVVRVEGDMDESANSDADGSDENLFVRCRCRRPKVKT